ncbi:riboflavin transporter 2 [Microcaecilia unicolor]|uniref:Riboflavin transporter n=1 Tax=Microcaecilia unicolor TaxID=1415580 RepID=A0A6P7ZFC6_9AMPH|nr:riboflavin transporter 2-like [Microcaecilia unicolor]XP_030076538.1 riboflavin transporter 2-like [Microcaecilia unicolor]XP_030076547.1 riboflavin transporter 2-like [Microcaecilia unicolor]
MALEVHLLACLLGMGSWVAINGMWVELPLIVPDVPEGWHLPSYLTLLIQFANLGPLFVMLLHQFQPARLNETAIIYTIISIGVLACLLLAFFWRETTIVGGAPHSTALLVLIFFLSMVDCTSSVTFLPFMMRLKTHYLSTYFIGEGLSGLIPGFVALAQGVGVVHCVNGSLPSTHLLDTNITISSHLQAVYQPARFPVKVFFLFLSGMMVICLTAFVLLNNLPSARREQDKVRAQPGIQKEGRKSKLSKRKMAEQKPMINDQEQIQSSFGTGTFSWSQIIYIFLLLAWANALTNGVLPAVQSYSCLPYGNSAYHLSATLAALANPLACLITMVLPNRSLMTLGILTTVGTGIGSYIMTMAVLSPCPLLLHTHIGVILIVLCWVLFVGLLSYVKVMIGLILRGEGHHALVWCGATVQLGSMVGALTMFPLVSVYHLFQSGDPCNTSCSL